MKMVINYQAKQVNDNDNQLLSRPCTRPKEKQIKEYEEQLR